MRRLVREPHDRGLVLSCGLADVAGGTGDAPAMCPKASRDWPVVDGIRPTSHIMRGPFILQRRQIFTGRCRLRAVPAAL